MGIRFHISGPNEQMGFADRARWAWSVQKRVAKLTGIRRWGPALLGKKDIDDEEIWPIILRESKSSRNHKSVNPVRYNKIPDDEQYWLGSSINFSSKEFSINYSCGGDNNEFPGLRRQISISFVNESLIDKEMLKKLFLMLLHEIPVSEAGMSDDAYFRIFEERDRINVRVKNGERMKIVRYIWTSLITFLPSELLVNFDMSAYNYEEVKGRGILVSMEGVEDVEKIMDFNMKIAALYGQNLEGL